MTQPRKHRHADMIRRWLEDDSLEVEFKSGKEWVNIDSNCDPAWLETCEYRFKSKMIKCGEHSFPEPMRVAPDTYAIYFVTDIARIDLCIEISWTNDVSDNYFLKRGLAHTTQAAAEAHARALIALTEVRE